jgi:cathepsin D
MNVQGAGAEEPGGIFTMGYLNNSLYTGTIEYTSLVNSGTYWLIPLTSADSVVANSDPSSADLVI